MPYYIYVIIFSLLMLPGIAGIFIPALPGIPLMFLLALVLGFIDKFSHLTISNVVILLIITLASVAIDYFSGILGAKYGGASGKSMLWGILGLIVGVILFPPFGGFFGLFLAVIISELVLHGNNKKAIRAASGSLLGTLAGIIINLILALLFLGLFIGFAIK